MALLSLGCLALTSAAWAHGEHPHAEHDLSKASQNPVSSLISLPFKAVLISVTVCELVYGDGGSVDF